MKRSSIVFMGDIWYCRHGIKLGIWGSGVQTTAAPGNLWQRVAKKLQVHFKRLKKSINMNTTWNWKKEKKIVAKNVFLILAV